MSVCSGCGVSPREQLTEIHLDVSVRQSEIESVETTLVKWVSLRSSLIKIRHRLHHCASEL